MSENTNMSITLECENLIDGLAKSAAKFESFSKRAESAIGKVEKKTEALGTNEKRVYELLKNSYDNHSKELRNLAKDYERLWNKKKSGQEFTYKELEDLVELDSKYKKHSNALRNTSKELEGLAKATSKFKNVDVKSSVSSALGGVGAILTSKIAGYALELGKSIVEVGTKTQQTISQFDAMSNSISSGAVAYQYFNDVARNTNYDFDAVNEMGKRLLGMGYSAKDAADLIQLCSDTAAGLGQGQAGADELVRTISMIQAAGKLEEDQLSRLQSAGMNMDEVFASLGLTGVEAMEALRKGTLDGQTAVKALTDYMHRFDGAMEKSKNNLVDQWGDVAGNIATICGEIGAGISDMVKESEIIKDLVGFTQSLIDLVRGEGCQAWKDFGVIAQFAVDTISNALDTAYTILKLGIILANELYEIFRDMFQRIYEKLKFILEPLGEIAGIFGQLFGKIGTEMKAGVDAEFKQTFIQKALPEEKSQLRKGLDRTTTASSSEATRVAQEEQKKYNKILADTEKIQKDIIQESTKRIGIDRELSMIGKTRVDQLKAEGKWIEEDAKRQKEAEEKLYSDRKAKLDEQIKYYEDNPGLPGSEATLKALNDQIAKETELHNKRLSNIDEEAKLKVEKNNEALKSLGIETNPGADLSTDSVDGFNLGLDKFMQSEEYLESIGIKLTQLDKLAANTLGKGFASAFEAIVNGSKSASEAFSEMAKQLLVQCANLLAQWTAIFALVTIWRGPQEGAKAANKMVLGLANGGYVSGPGTATSDSIPAMLSNGEYVINASAVQALGVGTMDMINSGHLPVARFSQGGMVGGSGGSTSISLHVSALDAASFEGFLQSGGLDKIKQALFDSDRNFAGLAGVW